MPITIKTATMQYKNASGVYVGVDAVAETTTSAQVAAVEAAGAEQIAEITAAAKPPIEVSGATVSITAEAGRRYICTTEPLSELTFTPSATGICSVQFVSGTTPTVLNGLNAVQMPDWWDGVNANRTYEITVIDGACAEVNVWSTADKNLEIAKALKFTSITGAFTNTQSSYGSVGTTDARVYVYPFGLAIAKFYFRITTTPGTTERIIATTTIKPYVQVGMTVTSQEGTYCSVFIDTSGNVLINTKSSDATGTYHVIIPYPIAPYIPA